MSPPKLLGQNESISSFEMDENYNQMREDLRKYNDDDEESEEESEEDDDDDDDVGDSKMLKILFDSLNKVKTRDLSIKDKDVTLFETQDDKKKDDKKQKKNKKKKIYLKDVQLLEDDDSDGEREKSHVEKQEWRRKALCEAVEAAEAEIDDEEEDDDDLLRVKERKRDDTDREEDEELAKKVDKYFGEEALLDENKKFLRDYFVSQMWKEKDEKGKNEAELEDAVEKQEEYEVNYRHEENAGEIVMGQSRKVQGSVRKTDTARKGQRKNKEKRMNKAQMEKQEKLKQSKNVKKRKIKEKMEKIENDSGKGKRKRETSSVVQRVKEALMEGYYKLDYEDTIGDLKTRFKYAKVEANSFKLDTKEILRLDDTKLNECVPINKIATYREKKWEANRHKVKVLKLGYNVEKRSKKKRHSDATLHVPGPVDEQGETSKLSRKTKRRRRQAKKKLPPNRLAAYGKAK